jgi:hypothetical protein
MPETLIKEDDTLQPITKQSCSKCKTSFSTQYEQAIAMYIAGADNPTLHYYAAHLKDRRERGQLKYQDISYQKSSENALVADVITHTMEELLDTHNYLLHALYQLQLMPDASAEQWQTMMNHQSEVEALLDSAKQLYLAYEESLRVKFIEAKDRGQTVRRPHDD